MQTRRDIDIQICLHIGIHIDNQHRAGREGGFKEQHANADKCKIIRDNNAANGSADQPGLFMKQTQAE